MEKFHIFSGAGMGKCQSAGPQRNLAGIIDLGIFPLTHQRKAPAGKLHPDLMGAACFQLNANFGDPVPGSKPLVVEYRLLDTLGRLRCHKGHLPGLVPAQQIPEGSRFRRSSMNHRQVFLFKFTLPDLTGQLRCGFGISRQHHQSADHPIQPVNRADIPLRLSQGFPDQIRQSSGLIGG